MTKAIIAGTIILNSLGMGNYFTAQIKAQTKATSKALQETIDIKSTTNPDSLLHIQYIHQELDSLATDIIVQETTKEINMIRHSYGLDTVILNDKLCKAAELHAQDMYEKDYYDHINKEGKHPGERIEAQHYRAISSLENIAKGHTIFNIVDYQRMQSLSHKKAILKASAKDIGIGYYKGYMVMLIANSH